MTKKKYEKPFVNISKYMSNNILSACNTSSISVTCKIGGQTVSIFGSNVSGCTEASDTFYYKYYNGNYYVIWYTSSSSETPNSTEQYNLYNIMKALGLVSGSGVSSIYGWHYAEYSTSLYGMS